MTRILFALLLAILAAVPASAQPVSGPWSRVILSAGPIITSGLGSPEGVITAPTGSIYLQADGAAGLTLWTKFGSGATGWTTTGGSGSGTSPHPLLSSTHSDTQTATAIRGAIIVGNSTPAWSRLTLGPAGSMLRSTGTDLQYSTDGSGLTALNASQLTTGTVPDARLSANVSLFGAAVDTAEIAPGAITFPTWASNGCTTGQIPKYSGSLWQCAPDDAGTGSGHSILSATHLDTVPGTLVAGDLLFANGTAALTRLPVGTAGQVLTVTAGAPAWAAPAAGVYCQTGENSAGSSGTAKTLDWNSGNQQLVTLTGNVTLTLSNPIAGCAYRVFLTQDATGGRTVTWPAAVKWGSLASAPTVIATAAAQTVCAFFYSGAAAGYQGFCDVGGGGASSPAYTTGITVDGAGSAFSTGVKGFNVAQRAGTIQRVTLLSTDAAATACSVVFDVWKDTYAAYPPTVADTITASAKPTLASANKSQDATLTGWTKTVAAGDVFGYRLYRTRAAAA